MHLGHSWHLEAPGRRLADSCAYSFRHFARCPSSREQELASDSERHGPSRFTGSMTLHVVWPAVCPYNSAVDLGVIKPSGYHKMPPGSSARFAATSPSSCRYRSWSARRVIHNLVFAKLPPTSPDFCQCRGSAVHFFAWPLDFPGSTNTRKYRSRKEIRTAMEIPSF